MNGGLRAMLLTRLKTAGLSVLAVAALVAGAHGLSGQAPTERPGAGVSDPGSASQRPATGDAPANPPAARPRTTAEAIVAKLASPASIDKAIDTAPLKDILDFISDKYQVTFIINARTFDRYRGMRNVEDQSIRLPRMAGVTLQTVLHYLLGQVEGTALVRDDHIEVAPLEQAARDAFGYNPQAVGYRIDQPLVNVICEQRRLDDVLADVARQAGCNVVVDSRVSGREKLVVSASLLNAPTDTAVRVLAELANLKSVQLDNVFFVTTREFAMELRKEEDKRAEARSREPSGPNAPPAQPSVPGPPKP
jgi:hypothetical protein